MQETSASATIPVFISPDSIVMPESAFQRPDDAGQTICIATIQTAAQTLGLRDGVITVDAAYHPSSDTYLFTHDGRQYRAFASQIMQAVGVQFNHAELRIIRG